MKPPCLSRCTQHLALLALSLVVVLQLAGCGGGTTVASGGIVGTGIAVYAQQGEITALADHAIVVNGQTIATAGATITINGQSASDTALMVGMVVSIITTTTSSGQSTSIEYHAEVQGVVSGVVPSTQVFTVLGQRVQTNALTIFVGGSFATLLNQGVEVSGFRSTPGILLATLVIIKPTVSPPNAPLEVTGVVNALDPVAHTFTVGAQLCDYRALATGSVPAMLANGATVRVDGTQTSPGGTLLVSAITVLAPSLPDSPKVEVEGLITAFAGLGSFLVNGQPTDARGAVIDGGTVDMLGNGILVNVQGAITGGVLIATQLEIEGVTVVTLDGTAQAVDPSAGTVTVGGQVVTVTATTQFIDSSTAALRSFALAAVQVGDRLTISAFRTATTLVATRVERLNPDAPPPGQPPTSIQGAITNFVSIADFVVAGVQVDAGGATFAGGSSAALANGVRVAVDGTLVSGTLNATTVQFLGNNSKPPTLTVTGAISGFASVSSFIVAGQTVNASSATFTNGNASDLANGRTVTATGIIQGGMLVAQTVAFATPPPTTLQVQGAISNFMSASNFVVNGQTVNASQATISNGTASDLANGVDVSVTGVLQNGVLMATSVQIQGGGDSQQISVHGRITNFVSVSNFTVAGQVVDANNAKFDGGTAADLANGQSVQVQGVLAGPVLKASELEFDD